MSTTPPIQTHALTHKYGRYLALDGVDLHIPPRAICALVGANGAGKTTLIKILTNLLLPTSGTATVLGRDSKHLSGPDMQEIGYVSENQELPLWMSTRLFLDYLRPFYRSWDRVLEEQLLNLLEIPMERSLKRGQRMKAAFVAALSYRPQLVILDEPFSGLDPLVREELISALQNIDWPATFLISSHDLDEIEGLATHLVFIDKGKVLFADPLRDVRGRFRNLRFQLPAHVSVDKAKLPAGWLNVRVETEPTAITCTHSAAPGSPSGADAIRTEVLALFPEAIEIESSPLSLRNIFLGVARDRRSHARKANA